EYPRLSSPSSIASALAMLLNPLSSKRSSNLQPGLPTFEWQGGRGQVKAALRAVSPSRSD
ncbi:MAG: hypothetical protein ACK5OA_02735, partial [Acidovorax sp.]